MLAAQFERWFGLPGVAWLFGALFLGFVVALYVVCRRQAEALPATVATGLAVIGATAQLSARPQVVTLIMLVFVVGAWFRAERTGKAPWVLIPLTWLWATAHGMWTLGVVVGIVWCVGLLLDRAVDRRAALRMLAVPVLSVVAACLTPIGPALLGTQAGGGRAHAADRGVGGHLLPGGPGVRGGADDRAGGAALGHRWAQGPVDPRAAAPARVRRDHAGRPHGLVRRCARRPAACRRDAGSAG